MTASSSPTLNRNKHHSLSRGVLLVTLSATAVTTSACVSDSDKCGDLLLWKDPTGKTYDLCTPGRDTDTIETTPVTPITDAGDDASVPDGVVCTEEADCPTEEYCDLTLSPPQCLPPPTGEGAPCETHADCAGFEADFCENYGSFTCLVQNCSPEANNCSDEYLCCDFAWMGLPSLCVNREFSGGVCYEP